MKSWFLIACVAEKASQACAARNMYQGELFPAWLAYAEAQNPDGIYILSGKYGLLDLDSRIEPYDVNLNEQSEENLQKWSAAVLEKIAEVADLQKDRFFLICNKTYSKYLIPALAKAEMLFDVQ